MKTLLIVSVAGFMSVVDIYADYKTVTLNANNTNRIVEQTFSISGNERVEYLYESPDYYDNSVNRIYEAYFNDVKIQTGFKAAGPGVVRVRLEITYNAEVRGFFTFNIDKNEADTSSDFITRTSIVIPTSATGDVDVKMEQSADNVTWTECLPGTYNSSTVKRFFRLRAVEK